MERANDALLQGEERAREIIRRYEEEQEARNQKKFSKGKARAETKQFNEENNSLPERKTLTSPFTAASSSRQTNQSLPPTADSLNSGGRVSAVPSIPSLSTLGRIPKRPKVETQEPSRTASAENPAVYASDAIYERPLDWYYKINLSRETHAGGDRAVILELRKFRELVDKCQHAEGNPSIFDEIRKKLHDFEFLEVSEVTLRSASILHGGRGLPRIFDHRFTEGVEYPWDIRADANELFNKWANRLFDPSLLRGMVIQGQGGGDKSKKTQQIESDYNLKVPCTYFGNGNLINGQWWPSQLCALRDGAHGVSQGGIHGVQGKGAYSIVLSGSHYEDRDEGDQIWYCGTDGKNFAPSTYTKLMLESQINNRPIRVLRSSQLQKSKSTFAPSHGYRYDGLYRIRSNQKISSEPEKCMFRFHLIRDPEQDPIRHKGIGLGARPTSREIDEFQKIRGLISGAVEG